MSSQVVIYYILKTTLISGIFFTYYWIVLRDKKFHTYNRFYLLSASILSFVIPMLKLDWFTVEEPFRFNSNEIIQIVLSMSNANKTFQLGWIDYTLVLAGMVTITLLSLLFLSIVKILLLKKKWDVTQMNGFNFINTNEENAPFSFLNNLFWKQSISLHDEGGQQIFKHEITHIQQKHTWDRIYCQIVTSIFWMNPFNWILLKELVAIHEFIADEVAVGKNNVEAFAKMLLQSHYGNHFLNPTHHFFYSSIKRRLTMLTKSTNTKYSYLKRVMVLPILIASVCLVSINLHAREKIEKKVEEIKNNISLLVSDTSKTTKKSSLKTPPTPPIPPKIKLAGLKGNKVVVTSKTSIDTVEVEMRSKNNQIKYSNLTLTTKDSQKTLDALAKKANVVITKKTEGGTEKYIIVDNQAEKASVKPAFYVNGEKITEAEMKAILPNDIESVNVLKGEHAIIKYPEDGKNGVVEIKLKHKN